MLWRPFHDAAPDGVREAAAGEDGGPSGGMLAREYRLERRPLRGGTADADRPHAGLDPGRPGRVVGPGSRGARPYLPRGGSDSLRGGSVRDPAAQEYVGGQGGV